MDDPSKASPVIYTSPDGTELHTWEVAEGRYDIEKRRGDETIERREGLTKDELADVLAEPPGWRIGD